MSRRNRTTKSTTETGQIGRIDRAISLINSNKIRRVGNHFYCESQNGRGGYQVSLLTGCHCYDFTETLHREEPCKHLLAAMALDKTVTDFMAACLLGHLRNVATHMGLTVKISQQAMKLFSLGQLRITPGALDAISKAGQSPLELVDRHQRGDWGDVCEADRKQNDLSVRNGFRVFSSYHTESDWKIWVITEADRSATTVLLPSEY